MSSNRRSYNARKRRGALTRTEHLALAKKRGQLATFREDPEANRQLQKDFNESGAYVDKRHDKSIRKSNDPKFMGSTETVGESNQSTTQTATVRKSPFYLSYPMKRNAAEETGDTFLIKCIEYTPPKPGEGMGLSADIQYYDKSEGFKGNGITIAGKKGARGQTGSVATGVKFKFNEANTRMQKTADKKTKYYIELPIPQEVNDANSVTWGEDSLNIFQLAGLAAAQRIMTNPGESFQQVSQLLQQGIPLPSLDDDTKNAVLAGISGQAINALGGNVSPGSVIARATGQILNSNLELLFKGVNLRSFPFSVTFSPRNYDEAIRVKTIIRYLKQTMAPKTGVEGGGTGIFLKSPDVFSLRYLHKGSDHPFLNSFKLCALTGLSVNYTNAGTYASYDGGTPVNIRMNMTFKELNPIYSEDYEGMGDADGVGF
tara:strand:+ start:2418 stop:3707 length:1290 start_codon:yes stop_codon:yes gene_type:complete